MKDMALFGKLKENKIFKVLKRVEYLIAAISFAVVFSLSILCLAVYLPHLSQADALDTGTFNILYAMLIIALIVSTAAFAWETLRLRKKRVEKSQTSVEDLIKNISKDSTNGAV